MKKYGVGLAILFFSAICLAAVTPANNISDSNKPIMVKKTQPTFTIVLKSNPTTGYSWSLLKYNADLIVPVKKVYQAPTSKLVGAGGVEVWTFKVRPLAFTVPHVIDLTLIYNRPWEKSDANSQSQTFKVVTYAN